MAIVVAVRTSSCSSSSRFAAKCREQEVHARHVAARPAEAGHETELDRVSAARRQSGLSSLPPSLQVPKRRRQGDQHRDVTADQIGGKRRQAVVVAFAQRNSVATFLPST